MSKPRVVSVKKAEQPQEQQASAAPRPKITREEDWSLLLEQARERLPETEGGKKAKSIEQLREEQLKDILPAEAGPGTPLELAKRKVRAAVERARGRGGAEGKVEG